MNGFPARWSTPTFLVYAGGVVCLASLGGLLATLTPQGAGLLTGYAALALVASLAVAEWLRRGGRAVASGIVAGVAVAMLGAAVAALAHLVGLDLTGGGWEGGRVVTELVVAVGALVLLGTYRAPLLVLPAAGGALALWLDLVDAVGGDTLVAWAALLAGIALGATGAALDATGGRAYGFWPHVLAAAATGFALLDLLAGSWWGWTLVALLSLAYVGSAWLLARSAYAVAGAVGLFAATTWFVGADSFAASILPLPFDDGDTLADWQIALVYVLLGVVYLVLGVALARKEEAPAT